VTSVKGNKMLEQHQLVNVYVLITVNRQLKTSVESVERLNFPQV